MDFENVIDLSHLCLKAGHRYLLKDVSWQVKKGEHWAVFGMNGCGKTTLLSILAGFRKETSGSVKILGQSYKNDNILTLRRRVAWVSGSFFEQKYSKESALDIVLSGQGGALGCNRLQLSDKARKRAQDLLKELHLGENIHHPLHMMSKGQRQNVLIARALFANPELLLLDEPCTGLDIVASEHLLNTLKDLAAKTHLTLVYVTHHPEEILLDVFQKTMLLKNGQSYAQGETTMLFSPHVFEDFLEAPVNMQLGAYHGLDIQVDVSSHVTSLIKEEER